MIVPQGSSGATVVTVHDQGVPGTAGPQGAGGASYAPVSASTVSVGDVACVSNVDATGKVTKITQAALDTARGRVGIVTVAAAAGGTPTVQTSGVVSAAYFNPGELAGASASDCIVSPTTGRPVRTNAYRPGVDVFAGQATATGNLNLDALPLSTTHAALFDANLYKTASNTWSQAILLAHTAAGTVQGSAVYLPPGTYDLDASLLLTQANFRIQGACRETTIIKFIANMSGGCFSPVGGTGDLGEFFAEGLTLDLNGRAGFGGYGLFLQALAYRYSRTTVRSVYVKDPGVGGKAFWLVGATNVVLDHVDTIAGTAVNGAYTGSFLEMQDCSNIVISYCSARQWASGIGVTGSYENIVIIGWNWHGCSWTGPAILSGSGAAVSYTATTLTDTGRASWAAATAGFPGGIVVRAFEARVAGTITTTASNRKLTLTDSATLVSTTVAAGSNGAALPQATINVTSTAGFPASGSILVATSKGPQTVTYAAKTGTTFTGCTGGYGLLATGGVVVASYGALENDYVRSPTISPVWEACIKRDGIKSGVLYIDGWRRVSDGTFGVGPNVGDTYTIYALTVCQPSFPASSTASVPFWHDMAGNLHTPANGSLYEIGPLPGGYGIHIDPNGPRPAPGEFIVIGSHADGTFGDGFSAWRPSRFIGCSGSNATDTIITTNDGVEVFGFDGYNAGIEGHYCGSSDALVGGANIVNMTMTKWGWFAQPAQKATAFRFLGITMHASGCHAWAENQACAIRCFEVQTTGRCQILDNEAHDISSGNTDMTLYAGLTNGLAQTFIRGRHVVDFTIPGGNFLGSPVWDLRTPQFVNGVVAGQPTSRVMSEIDGNEYVKPLAGGTTKAGWKITQIANPPPFDANTFFGSANVVSQIKVDGNVSDVGGVANAVADTGLMAAHPPTAPDAGHRPAYAADAQFANKQTIAMTANKGLLADWAGTQIDGATDATFIFVGRVQNTGGTGNTAFVAEYNTADTAAYMRAGGNAEYRSGSGDYSHASPAIAGNLPQVTFVVWDRTNGQVRWYENDVTAPKSTDGAPGSAVFNSISLGMRYTGAGYFAEGVLAYAALIKGAASAAQVYAVGVQLSVDFGVTITT